MHGASLSKHSIRVDRQFEPLPTVFVEKSKLLQVIDNLIKNAIESMSTTERGEHVLTIVAKKNDASALISVSVTGHGIRPEHHKNIFRFGFTTKSNGNGFGLHSAAIAMNEIGGSIRVSSDGWGNGAIFTLTVPLRHEATPEDDALKAPIAGATAVATPVTATPVTASPVSALPVSELPVTVPPVTVPPITAPTEMGTLGELAHGNFT
jgi:hypothetical protein